MSKNKFIASIIFTSMILLTSCAHVTQEQISKADFGRYPSNYQADIKNYMSMRLKDPYSAVYQFGTPSKGYAFVQGTIRDPFFGYLVDVGVNAKNSYGGYVGEKLSTFFFKDDRFWEIDTYAKGVVDNTVGR